VVSAGAAVAHGVTRWAVRHYQAAVHLVRSAVHVVARAATATVTFVKHHAAAIASIVVSVAVFAGCEAVLTGISSGALSVPGAVACGALAGAVGNAVGYGITAAQTGKFSLSGLAGSIDSGAVSGALGGFLGGVGGRVIGMAVRAVASALLTDGAATAATREAASAAAGGLTTTAARDATSTAEDAAAVCRVNSFTGNTKVLLPGSKTIAISRVKAGQKVLATDPYTGKTAARQVAQVIRHHGVHAMALIALLGGGLIHATAHHPIYDATTKTFTYAASLHPGDKAARSRWPHHPRHQGHRLHRQPHRYNLDVTGIHTYYALAGTAPVLVHNSCGGAAEATQICHHGSQSAHRGPTRHISRKILKRVRFTLGRPVATERHART
jgi:hypothetical protein